MNLSRYCPSYLIVMYVMNGLTGRNSYLVGIHEQVKDELDLSTNGNTLSVNRNLSLLQSDTH